MHGRLIAPMFNHRDRSCKDLRRADKTPCRALCFSLLAPLRQPPFGLDANVVEAFFCLRAQECALYALVPRFDSLLVRSRLMSCRRPRVRLSTAIVLPSSPPTSLP